MQDLRESPGAPRWRDPATGAALVVASLLVQLPLFDRTIVPMDEGHLAAAADWMLDGKRLYVDIHTGIFPGIYLITSGLFGLFGRDLIVTRIAAVAMNVTTMLALWLAARRIADRRWALAPPLLHVGLVAFAFPVLSMFNYSTLALCFGIVALVFLLRYLEGGRTSDGAVLGVLVAAAALTKQNFGGLVFVSLWIGLAWGRRESALAERSHLASIVPIGVAGAAVTLGVVAIFGAQGALPALVDSTLVSLGGSQMRHFDNPIPPLLGPHPDDLRFMFLYSPPALFNALAHGEPFLGLPVGPGLRSIATRLSYGLPIGVLLVSLLLLPCTRSQPPGTRRASTRAVVSFAAIFSLGVFPSAIWSHLAFVLPPIGLLVAWLADRLDARLRARAPQALLWGWRTAVALVALAIVATAAQVVSDVVKWNPLPLDVERARVRVSPRDRAVYHEAIAFVDDCAARDEAILAIPDIPIVYFLTDRENPSPYDLMIPGNVDGARVVQRIRSEGVRCIVMNPRMYPEFPPFKQLFPRLTRVIEREFRGERVLDAEGARWIGLVRRGPGSGRGTANGTSPTR